MAVELKESCYGPIAVEEDANCEDNLGSAAAGETASGPGKQLAKELIRISDYMEVELL